MKVVRKIRVELKEVTGDSSYNDSFLLFASKPLKEVVQFTRDQRSVDKKSKRLERSIKRLDRDIDSKTNENVSEAELDALYEEQDQLQEESLQCQEEILDIVLKFIRTSFLEGNVNGEEVKAEMLEEFDLSILQDLAQQVAGQVKKN